MAFIGLANRSPPPGEIVSGGPCGFAPHQSVMLNALEDAFRPSGAGQPSAKRTAETLAALDGIDLDSLSTRTLEVAYCVLAGDSNAEIARFLGISISTVKYHLAKIVRTIR
jgi:DNA-binding NarL/FixJ family response regulator